MEAERDLLELTRRYLAAIEQGATGPTLAAFFAPGVVQHEFPNRLVANGAERDLAAILDGAERGQKVMSGQRYEIISAFTSGQTVVLEVQWTGTLAIALGSLPAGGQMRARFAVFIEYQGDKIIRQRNYDCFDPW